MSGKDAKKGHAEKKKAIDWDEVKRRIENAGDAIVYNRVSSTERKKALKERARLLASEEAAPEADDRLDVVEFVLAHERYAVESRFVREIHPMHELTPVPCTPAFVLGVINVRGQIVSVVDIKKFFDLPEKGITDLNKVIILRLGGMEFGILADVIVGVRRLKAADMEAELPTLTGIRAEYLKGVTKERLTVIDAQRLLTDRGIIIEENVEA